MKIQLKQWDGQGYIEDPKTGTNLSASPQALLTLIHGRSVTGIGGVSPNTESIVINLEGMNLWFVTTDGIPRIVFQKYPA
jgi:hypothetical protein